MSAFTFRKLVTGLAAGVLGFLLNSFLVPVLGQVSVFFGSICGLVITIVYGPLYGLLTAAIAAAGIPASTESPAMRVTLLVEVLVIGWLVRRRYSAFTASVLFWAVIGIPWLALAIFYLHRIPSPENWARLVKWPFNGILNILIADLLLILLPTRKLFGMTGGGLSHQSLRTHLWKGATMIAAIPLLLLTIINGNRQSHQQQTEAAQRLQDAASAISKNVEEHVLRHRDAVVSLSRLIEREKEFDRQHLLDHLEQYHRVYSDIITLTIADHRGEIRARHTTSTSAQGLSRINDSIYDRDYFQKTMFTGQPLVSEVIMGRISSTPIVVVTSPLFRDGKVWGIVAGSLNLQKFQGFIQHYESIQESQIIIADGQKRVIYSHPENNYRSLESLAEAPLVKAVDNRPQLDTFTYNTPGRENWMVAHSRSAEGAWKVFVQQPMRQVWGETHRYYMTTLIWLTVVLIAALMVSAFLAARITRPLEQLVQVVRGFNTAQAEKWIGDQVKTGEQSPAEIAQLVHDFGRMGARLSDSYKALRTALAEQDALNEQLQSVLLDLDGKVNERTAELARVNDSLRSEIIERRRIEQELKENAEHLARSNKELLDFASIASHDLQEPLRKVQLLGDRLKGKYGPALDAGGRDYLERMTQSTGRMQTLIDDLLMYSRVTTRARPFTLVNLNQPAAEAISDLESRLEKTCGTVHCENLPTILADATQMRQVFQNLIGNGLKFHRPDTAPRVTVTSESIQDETGQITHWQIRIADNGIGFDEKYLDKIFTIFQRLHHREQYEGTGVGLAVVKKILERHGGTITAHSQPGHGATFTLTLPFTAQELAADSPEKILSASTSL